mmetsp:Transcript_6704/g.5017  ORF Transcript_6704/g.5017 Transcript_6704/m.5017 type:complete len:83 (+) Transcript_6704:504-752(+)
MYGSRFNAQQSLEKGILTSTYKPGEDLIKQVKAFEKEFASKGAFRDSAREMKKNVYRDISEALLNPVYTKRFIQRIATMGKL